MFRVVVNPLLSRAVGCIRHQIPVRSLSRSFRRKDRKRNRENADNDEFRRGSTGLVWERRIGGTVSTIFVREIGLRNETASVAGVRGLHRHPPRNAAGSYFESLTSRQRNPAKPGPGGGLSG